LNINSQKTDLEILQDCYDQNLKIEHFCELKVNPPLADHHAEKLLNNCRRALKIFEKYQTDYDKQMTKEIEDMEDQLCKRGRIGIITYNLGARTLIHVGISGVKKYWVLKNE
jgi:hypothetical protein